MNLLSSIENLIHNIHEHNFLIEQLTANIQDHNNISWKRIKEICENNPEAKLCAVLPEGDIYQHLFSPEEIELISNENREENHSFKYSNKIFQTMNDRFFSLFADIKDSGNVSIYLPIIDIQFNDQYIVFCAKEFVDADICSQINIDHHTVFTGKSFIERFLGRDNYCFYDNNPPSLFVEYIQNFYFEKIGWNSSHPKHRVVDLFNPTTLGIRSLGFTPHY